ncbi:MAG: hypothetical protein AB1641_07275 [Thermodesulfobacteriota bacterium]
MLEIDDAAAPGESESPLSQGMNDKHHEIPKGLKLGKAKTLEVVVLSDGTRLPGKAKVRYWIERRGAREDMWIIHNEKTYRLSFLEFKRRFKVLIKGGLIRQNPLPEDVQD